MSSHFDDAFAEAVNPVLDTFGEKETAQYSPPARPWPAVNVVLHRNLRW